MRKFIADLMVAAMETAELLGHQMYRWRRMKFFGGSAVSFCRICGRGLSAMADPPDGTDEIGGSANLYTCKGENDERFAKNV